MTNFGGVERIVQEFVTEKNAYGIENYLICSSYNSEVVKPIVEAKVPVFFPKRIFKYDITILFRIIIWVKSNKIDIIHSYNAYSNSLASIVSLFSGIPLICSEHGTVWKTNGVWKLFDAFAYRRAVAVTANSSASKLLLKKKYGISESKIHILHNPVSKTEISESKDEIKERLGFANNQYVVGTVGRLVRLKGIEVFLRAAYDVLKRREDTLFVIVGGGEEEQRLRKINSSLGNSKNVVFLGWRNDARRILKTFDIFVCTSYRESFGNVLIESGHEKIPVIAPSIDGIPEAVDHNVTGILIEPNVPIAGANVFSKHSVIGEKLVKPKAILPKQLSGEIQRLLESPDLRRKLGQGGFLRAENFSFNSYASRLFGIYDTTIKNLK